VHDVTLFCRSFNDATLLCFLSHSVGYRKTQVSDCTSSTGALFIGINGVMVSVFASSTVDRGQSPDKDETLRIGLVQSKHHYHYLKYNLFSP
jgi:hypothetical protein